MTPTDKDAMVTAANPLSSHYAAALPVDDAEAEMVRRIVETPVTLSAAPADARRVHRRRLVLLLMLAAAVAGVVALLRSTADDKGGLRRAVSSHRQPLPLVPPQDPS